MSRDVAAIRNISEWCHYQKSPSIAGVDSDSRFSKWTAVWQYSARSFGRPNQISAGMRSAYVTSAWQVSSRAYMPTDWTLGPRGVTTVQAGC